jgi:NAD+ synthase (glutamine-hydrolysing)
MVTAPFGFLRVGAAAPRLKVADPTFNMQEILSVVAKAREKEVQVLVFPELSLTGYSAGDLFGASTLLLAAEKALSRLCRETSAHKMVVVVGLPLSLDHQLFNCAAVVQGGRLLGLVPKTFIPSYREFYEERWFRSSRGAVSSEAAFAGYRVPFGTDLLFSLEGDAVLAVEICEDLWVPLPPSSRHALAGATVILNPSASNEAVGKAEYRRGLVTQQSARTISGYVYAGCGVHESTTDVVFGGQLMVAENGVLLAESERFNRESALIATEIDTERLAVERRQQNSFGDSVRELKTPYRRVALDPIPAPKERRLLRRVEPHPFVPEDPASLDERCREIFSIQTAGLAKRLEHTGLRSVVVGVSGGLDSTLALLVSARTFDLLSLSRSGILGVTMPGFGTTGGTLGNARRLTASLEVGFREIDIRPACLQHMKDIGLTEEAGVTFENLQARERTQVLMDLANKEGGLVVGTGDLSELALGFCTYGGDHLAMYNVNAGVPKTLVKRLIEWVAGHHTAGAGREVLLSILKTPVSPELLRPGADGAILQRTEDIIGPYELHDFFLFSLLRLGAGPRKILFLAEEAFSPRYEPEALKGWLRLFLERFFDQQFKRSALPDGPKVGSVSLSPRGDWRMPSDASKAAWLLELD